MQVKRFVAADMRRALELVRQQLGADAVILANRRTPEGVELLASLAQDSAFSSPPDETGAGVLPNGKTGPQLAEEIEQAHRRLMAARNAADSAKEHLKPATVKTQSAAERYGLTEPAPRTAAAPELAALQAELADMRMLLEQQLEQRFGPTPLGGTPVSDTIARRLERLGLPANMIEPLLQTCRDKQRLTDAWSAALAGFGRQLPTLKHDVVDRGGIFALVGPTGAGKTTTIGKLAARYVMRHGADKVALVTTDSARIAAHEQLRSLGRILKVPVRVVDADNPLPAVLRSLRRCSLVLIDTAGFRHGDPALKHQLAELARFPVIKTLLVLSCNSQEQMLKASVHAYGAARLRGCILTKLDETASLGGALAVAAQSRLPICYITDGQDIPRDISLAKPNQLVARAAALLKPGTAAGRAARAGNLGG